MNSRFAQGMFLVFVTVLLWGVQFPIAKSAFASVDPFHVTAIRYALGTLARVAHARFPWSRALQPRARRHHRRPSAIDDGARRLGAERKAPRALHARLP